jgi:hypothetical protein
MAHITNEKFFYFCVRPILHCINEHISGANAMSTAIITTTATAGSLDSTGRSVMAWLRSLLRATPPALAEVHGSKSHKEEEVPSYYKVGVRMSLLRWADELEASAPHEAAKLRARASAI